jgi:hypothetical protein
MSFVSAVNCAMAQVQGSVNGRDVSIGLTCEYTVGAYDQAAIDALAGAVDDWATVQLRPILASEATYVNTHVRGLTSAIDLEADNGDGTGAGGELGEVLPNNVSYVIAYKTGLTGRSARGRGYLFGIPNVALDANEDVVTAAYRAAVESCFDNLPAFLVAQDWRHVVLSYVTAGVANVPAVIRPVTDYITTDARIDTRRKRLG